MFHSTCNIYLPGPPSAVANLEARMLNATFIKSLWSPPSDAQLSIVSYVVVVKNGIGVALYNMSIREPTLDIAIPDPCDKYDVTVTAVYGSCLGLQNTSLQYTSGEFLRTTHAYMWI